VNFVDLFGGRWLAVGLDAIVLASFASRLAGIGFGLALGKGSGLAFGGAEGRIELPA
jgi:hypothetical protein